MGANCCGQDLSFTHHDLLIHVAGKTLKLAKAPSTFFMLISEVRLNMGYTGKESFLVKGVSGDIIASD
jgi:hypothetical protein